MAASFRPTLGALAALLAAAAALPAAAADAPRRIVVHPRTARPAAAPLGVVAAPGVIFETPFAVVAGTPDRIVRVPHYIGPDGTYDEYADLIKSINGTPCGQDCTRRSLVRWGYAPDE